MEMEENELQIFFGLTCQIFVGGNFHHSNTDFIFSFRFSRKTENIQLEPPKHLDLMLLIKAVQTDERVVLHITSLILEIHPSSGCV